MQSSTAIAIRALVMLIVLISVPLFAIFGKNLPEVVKGVLEGRGLVLGPAPAASKIRLGRGSRRRIIRSPNRHPIARQPMPLR